MAIKTTPKKSRALTEHQKEVLREQKNHPALYNSIDASVDASLMANLYSANSQSQFTPE